MGAGRPGRRQLQLSVCDLDSSRSSGDGEQGQVLLSLAFWVDDSQSGRSSLVHGNQSLCLLLCIWECFAQFRLVKEGVISPHLPSKGSAPVVFWSEASLVFAVLEVIELAFKRLGARLPADCGVQSQL